MGQSLDEEFDSSKTFIGDVLGVLDASNVSEEDLQSEDSILLAS